MEKIELHQDFKEFLIFLNSHNVEYLLVGGYAVGYYGYSRATGDMDIWVAVSEENANKIEKAIIDFGIPTASASKELFLNQDVVVGMGYDPVRIEIITKASGVDFKDCYIRREVIIIDNIPINFISLNDLKKNKKESGRYKDLEDLKHLP